MDLKALHRISYGLFAVGSSKDGRQNGQIANTVFQITSDPPTIAVSINRDNYSHECIRESGAFSISVLSKETPLTFIGLLGFRCGRDFEKLKEVRYRNGKTGSPVILENAVACLEARVVSSLDVGTHTVFVGEVVDAEVISAEAEPMTYAYYRSIKGGKTPRKAPTYSGTGSETEKTEQEEKAGGKMSTDKKEAVHKRYVCTVCGYVYDPQVGDPDGGIAAGTPFESLPDDWVCPVCGAGKDQFEEEV